MYDRPPVIFDGQPICASEAILGRLHRLGKNWKKPLFGAWRGPTTKICGISKNHEITFLGQSSLCNAPFRLKFKKSRL